MQTASPHDRTVADGQVSNGPLAISAVGLTKSFGNLVALDGLDLAVAHGSVTALIGPNGSGKTTTVRLLSTLLAPDSGQATIFGHDVVSDPEAVRAAIGVTGQFSAVDKLFTGRENLLLMASLHHLGRKQAQSKIKDLLARFDLVDSADRPAATYSGGMIRRLDLAMTLMGDPKIIFLDEPTTGLDPRGRRILWDVVRDLVADGMTILLTTQYLEEADRLADWVILIDRGKRVAEGTPAALKQRVPGGRIRIHLGDEKALTVALSVLSHAHADDDGLSLVLSSDGRVNDLRQVLDTLEKNRIPVESLSAEPPDLEDVFFALTGDNTTHRPPYRNEASR